MRSGVTGLALVAASVCALWLSGIATAEERGIDPNQGDSLVEVSLANKGAALRLQFEAERYGIEFNDHYLRQNADGSVTVTVFGSEDELQQLDAAGFDLGATIEGPDTWRARIAERQADIRQENRADAAALADPVTITSHDDEIVILRVDYFENYAGRFLSVEAKDRLGTSTATGATYQGPALSLSFNEGAGTPIDSEPRAMSVNIDPDTSPDTYIEHRLLVRIGEAGTTDPAAPTRVRVGSSTGEFVEQDVHVWLGGGLPPMNPKFQKDFTTHYMDPTEVYQRFQALAAEFPNISEIITLPYKTNGYQRKAQANMSGALPSGNTPSGATAQSQTVVLTSRAWGHEGGNDITAEFRNPGVPNSPLTVSVTGNDILVSLATNAAGALTSTGAQVVDAINANAAASRLVVANRFTRVSTNPPPAPVPGAGIVQPRAKVNLSDFLTTSTNSHVQRGPFEYSVMRIGKRRDGSDVGVFLYCQQHAREWATPLTCLETAEQLLRNYATDNRTRKLVDNLDIFILPSSNPDGAHYSMHNFSQQRRNMTNHCVEGGDETDDPFGADFWTPRINPSTGVAYVNTDPASRNAWGVD